ncbi:MULTISPECIES: DNA cytosine methyltransferase [Pseudonocardia]|uniref:DNA cytosine methyltransferase n=1 Tax=Pseudonocardia TaxID=1847 RepID=UPI001CF65ADA|nr:DNA cytosine methyltransferase [Pseudonocardia abyssalis]
MTGHATPRHRGTAFEALTRPITIGSLCSGVGGLELGVMAALSGCQLSWCSDIDSQAVKVLSARFADVPNLGDIRALDWTRLCRVEVLTTGFPCQDISAAGCRAGVENGDRSGLWDVLGVVRVVRPRLLVVENVAALRWRGGGLGRVLGDLAATGYDSSWRSVCADDVGAPHRRERVFLLAWPRSEGPAELAADADRARRHIKRPERVEQNRWALPTGSDPRSGGCAGLPAERMIGKESARCGTADFRWGVHGAALARWERALGRRAPRPLLAGRRGQPVLAPEFVEFLMGLPVGWVTGLAISRTAQLRLLGNGVVPAQAAHAVALLLREATSISSAAEVHAGASSRKGAGWDVRAAARSGHGLIGRGVA